MSEEYGIKKCPFLDTGQAENWCMEESSVCIPIQDPLVACVVLNRNEEALLPLSVARVLRRKGLIEFKKRALKVAPIIARDYRLCENYQNHVFHIISAKEKIMKEKEVK